MSEKKVEVKVQLDEKVYRALEYYVPITEYWKSNDEKDKVISEWIADAAKEWLKMEAHEPRDAISCITTELKLLLELEE